MASTLTIQSTAYSGRYLQLDCVQTKDIATNTSTIKWTLTSTGGASNYYTTGPTTVTIGGTQVYYIARKGWTTEAFPAAKGSVSGTLTIKHDDEGKKNISVSLSTAIYTSTVSTSSKNWELDSIPRKATLTYVPDFTDLDNPTIKYSNLAGTAVSSLKACIALDGSTIVVPYGKELNKTGDLTYTFDLTNYRDALRNATTGTSRTMYVYVRTNIGGVNYYDNLPFTFTIKESATTKPSVTINVTLNNGSLPSAFDGLYIQNKSRVDVTLTAQGKYNASINSRYAVIDGQTYGSLNDNEPFTSNVIQSQGKVDIVGYAKDSREFTGSDTETVDVIAYSKPLVVPLDGTNAILCYRSDGNGKKVGGSTSLWVKAEKSHYSVNGKNSCALQYRYKLSTTAWEDSTHKWADLIPKTATSTNQYDALIPDTVFDLKKSYTIQIRAIDDIGEYDLKSFDIPTEDVALHLGKGGKNVSVGSYCDYSEPYTFHSEWKAIFDNGIHGTVINQRAEDVFDFALKCGQGVTPIYTDDETANLPPIGDFRWSLGFVQNTGTQISIFLIDYASGEIAMNLYALGVSDAWNGWKYLKSQ